MDAARDPLSESIDGAVPEGDGLHRVRLRDGRTAFLKQRRDRPATLLQAEARGLRLLRSAGGVRVPDIYAEYPHALLLEDLGEGMPTEDFQARAAHGLARQHLVVSSHFGLEHDGWCGDSPQDNTVDTDGHHFFATHRLQPQALRAHRSGYIDDADHARVQRLCERLPEFIPRYSPSLLHGDLWSGNLHCCSNGEPALIDAGAAHYGWAEADLAMLTLFGDPGPRFFAQYAEHAALASDWRERAPLYNLYHLLNHLNLFGRGYLGAVRSVLRRFVGAA
ncbi:fructosamine kinase family protein [Oleiagrimonas soli]|uniref:Fructosamine-3-kinase n=1 Tax=Oleiagrimonas soli TaxID=1543381 RepID=A0A841KLV5_9GAMM|nr:fructosamine kinase family protein [Oleiagrimonas soli]MBB6182964.1 fructosamine-3-kinase [Oleiagrimonas soli]